jgi:hypothetical protein
MLGSTATILMGIMMFSLSVLVEETVMRLVAELITTFIEGSFVGLTNLVEKVTHLSTHNDGC